MSLISAARFKINERKVPDRLPGEKTRAPFISRVQANFPDRSEFAELAGNYTAFHSDLCFGYVRMPYALGLGVNRDPEGNCLQRDHTDI